VKSKGVKIAVLAIAFVVVAGGSFWLGTYYETQSRMSRMRQFAGMAPGQGQQRMGGQQGELGARQQGPGFVTGKVDKVTTDTITITTRSGSQKITLTSKTAVTKAAKGEIGDIKPGSQIMVRGEGDPGEKIEAESIQILSN
jgi:hypothetical protein